RREREKPGGMHLARVRDEHDAVTVANACAVAHGAAERRCPARPGAPGALEDDAAEVRRLGRRDDVAAVLAQIEQALEEPLGGLGRDGCEPGAAPDRDEEEEAPSRGAQLGRQSVDRREVAKRLLSHQGVDLEWKAREAAGAGGLERAVETPGHLPEPVVTGGVGAVEAERDRGD